MCSGTESAERYTEIDPELTASFCEAMEASIKFRYKYAGFLNGTAQKNIS